MQLWIVSVASEYQLIKVKKIEFHLDTPNIEDCSMHPNACN